MATSATGELNFDKWAASLVDFIESDFGTSGPPVRFEAIKCELEAAYKKGFDAGRAALQSGGSSEA